MVSRLSSRRVLLALLAGLALVYPVCAGQSSATAELEPLVQADKLAREGRHTEAAEAYRAYLHEYPNDDEARASLAKVLSWQGQYDESERLYRDILSRHPQDLDVATALARVLGWQKRWADSMALYELVLKSAPNHMEAACS